MIGGIEEGLLQARQPVRIHHLLQRVLIQLADEVGHIRVEKVLKRVGELRHPSRRAKRPKGFLPEILIVELDLRANVIRHGCPPYLVRTDLT